MKNLLTTLVLLFVLSIFRAEAQPMIEWQKSFGGTSQDRAYDIRQTSDNGYVVVGFSNSNNGDVSGCYANSDFWVAKLDQFGNLQW